MNTILQFKNNEIYGINSCKNKSIIGGAQHETFAIRLSNQRSPPILATTNIKIGQRRRG